MKVRGNTENLSDGRVVFVGRDLDNLTGGMIYLGFVNSAGKSTRLALTADACTALQRLLVSPTGEDRFYEPMSTTYAWHVVTDK